MFRKVLKGEYSYMEDLNSNTIQIFFEGVGPIKKQNRGGLTRNNGGNKETMEETMA